MWDCGVRDPHGVPADGVTVTTHWRLPAFIYVKCKKNIITRQTTNEGKCHITSLILHRQHEPRQKRKWALKTPDLGRFPEKLAFMPNRRPRN